MDILVVSELLTTKETRCHWRRYLLEVNIKYTLNKVKYEVLDSAKGPKDCKKLQFRLFIYFACRWLSSSCRQCAKCKRVEGEANIKGIPQVTLHHIPTKLCLCSFSSSAQDQCRTSVWQWRRSKWMRIDAASACGRESNLVRAASPPLLLDRPAKPPTMWRSAKTVRLWCNTIMCTWWVGGGENQVGRTGKCFI